MSSNTGVLRTAEAVAPEDVRTELVDALAELPVFDPDQDIDPLPAPVARLRARIAAADAVLFSAPEYADTLPGAFKNLLGQAQQLTAVHVLNLDAVEDSDRGRRCPTQTRCGSVVTA